MSNRIFEAPKQELILKIINNPIEEDIKELINCRLEWNNFKALDWFEEREEYRLSIYAEIIGNLQRHDSDCLNHLLNMTIDLKESYLNTKYEPGYIRFISDILIAAGISRKLEVSKSNIELLKGLINELNDTKPKNLIWLVKRIESSATKKFTNFKEDKDVELSDELKEIKKRLILNGQLVRGPFKPK